MRTNHHQPKWLWKGVYMSMTSEDKKEFVLKILKEKGVLGSVEESIKSIFHEHSLFENWLSEEKAKSRKVIEASKLTLQENRHLADGKNCTLKVLKDAIESLDIIWEE
jgi:hypothetical protein